MNLGDDKTVLMYMSYKNSSYFGSVDEGQPAHGSLQAVPGGGER